jgi:glycosyltransferase involved in cell wall biosynthesis
MSTAKRFSDNRRLTVALIAPSPPPYGGPANQAVLLKEHLIRSGVPVLRTLVRAFFFVYRLVIISFKCNVFHVMACSYLYFFLHVLPSILIARVFGKYVMVNYRGGEAYTFISTLGRPFLTLLRKADRITVPSGYLQQVFAEIGLKTSILPNIVEVDQFQHRLPRQTTSPEFICTRNFEPYYDIPTAIRAFGIVKAAIPQSKLTLIGDGVQRGEIERLLTDLDLSRSVTMLGRLDPEEVAQNLSRTDIFINSSITDNYPNSILEAFATGLPVVTTSAGGIPYLVEHENNGLLVRPRDYKSMAEAMIRLANDHQLCLRLSRAGKETADRHSWSNIWPLLQKAYGFI